MTKKEQYENHRKTFLEIRDLFLQNHENFALAKAFHKPMKFYGGHTKNECVEILRKEANKANILVRFSNMYTSQ